MPVATCGCGARYKLPAEAAGRKARCRKCGSVFVVPSAGQDAAPPAPVASRQSAAPPPPGEIPSDDLASLGDGIALERVIPLAPRAAPAVESVVPVPPANVAYGRASVPAGGTGTIGAYLRSLGKSILALRTSSNVVTFVIMSVILCGGCFAKFSCVAGAALFIIQGWYMAFLLNTVHAATGGDDDLPSLTMTGGMLEDVILPFLRVLAVYIFVRLPALIFLLSLAIQSGSADLSTLIGSIGYAFWIPGMNGVIAPGETDTQHVVELILLLCGASLFPMMMMLVAVEGVPAIARVDLILITIARTAPIYVIVTLICIAALALQVAATISVLLIGAKGKPASGLLLDLAIQPVKLLFMIIAMKAIGLYYHHFKARFAWQWD